MLNVRRFLRDWGGVRSLSPPLAPKGEPVDRRVGGGLLRTSVDRGDRPVDQRVGGGPLRRDPCTAVGELGGGWLSYSNDCAQHHDKCQRTQQGNLVRGLKMDRWTAVGSGDRPVDKVENQWGRSLLPNVQIEGKTLFWGSTTDNHIKWWCFVCTIHQKAKMYP